MEKVFSYDDVTLEGMEEVAARIANAVPSGVVLLMEGEMGAGKTTLTKLILRSMGSDDTVSSPTFSLVNQYVTRSGETVYHFDFYRIDDIEEAYDMGCEEYFYSGCTCVVEWGERVREIIPRDSWMVKMEKTPHGRNITLCKP